MDDHGVDVTAIDRPDDLTGKIIGRFRITSFIGKGGMGEVYRAEDPLLKRTVALKRVSPKLRSAPLYRDLLIKEAERASALNNERIAHVHDVLEDGGEIFVVMEFVEGTTLRERFHKDLPVPEFLSIATQCAEALRAAHQSGIIHRDIKPENIMITPEGRVKVCDFGLARQVPTSSDTTKWENADPSSGFQGTPAYMSPEALLNRDLDARSDIFSLGIVFYEALTGKHPFRELDNYVATVDAILHATPDNLSALNSAVPAQLENCRQNA